MPDDRFFTSVVLQLINPPQSSRDVLSAAQLKPPVIPPKLEFEIDSARSWAGFILQNAYQPRGKDLFVPFPKENGRFDVIRCTYRARDMEISIAQSKYVISISVAGIGPDAQKPDREKAEIIAGKILAMPDRIRFQLAGTFVNGHFGRQEDPRGKIDPEWPHWLDLLRWWSDGSTVGFVTLKASGGPTREVISVEDQANIHWF